MQTQNLIIDSDSYVEISSTLGLILDAKYSFTVIGNGVVEIVRSTLTPDPSLKGIKITASTNNFPLNAKVESFWVRTDPNSSVILSVAEYVLIGEALWEVTNDMLIVDSDVTLPTVNAVKSYVSNVTAGGVTYRGTISLPATFYGTTSNNYLNNATEVETGDMFVAIGSGNLTMSDGDIYVANGDALIINTSNPKNAITKAMIDDISPTYPGIEVGDYKRRAVSYSPGLGWLLCDGQAVSRTTYSLLFNVIGETFGVGDGSTTFNLPNANGRVSVTAGTAPGLTNRFVGDVFGEERTTLTLDEMPAHDHDFTYQYKDQNAPYGDNNRTVWEYVENRTRTTTSAGGGQSHNNLQPSIVDGFLFIYAGV